LLREWLTKYNLSPDTIKTGKKTKNTPPKNSDMIFDDKNTGSSLVFYSPNNGSFIYIV
jgi:hypothetical protein